MDNGVEVYYTEIFSLLVSFSLGTSSKTLYFSVDGLLDRAEQCLCKNVFLNVLVVIPFFDVAPNVMYKNVSIYVYITIARQNDPA